MKELSLCTGRKDHKEAIVIIKTIGKSIGKIKSPHIFKKQILLKPTSTRNDSIEEQLRRMAEVNGCQMHQRRNGAVLEGENEAA